MPEKQALGEHLLGTVAQQADERENKLRPLMECDSLRAAISDRLFRGAADASHSQADHGS